jgi:hypothetical protein
MPSTGSVVPPAPRSRGALGGLTVALVLGGVYWATLLPGPGHSHDTAEVQFSAPLLCVTHPTGYPSYLLVAHAFSRLLPLGTPAFRLNLLSAVFSVLAGLVLRRLLRRLGVRDLVATSTALAFGLTPNVWRFSVVAEVYSLNLLFVTLVSDRLLEWRRSLKTRDLIVACAVYVLSFGNHLTMVTLLPAFAFVVLATRWRVISDGRTVAAVGGLILLGLLPYGYPVWRSLDPHTPYLAASVTSLPELWRYATGAGFRGEMFAFSVSQLVAERLPMFLRLYWRDCAPLILPAVVGLAALRDRVSAAYLGLVLAGHLAFALGYAIGDVDNYFIPCYLVTAVLAGVGLERLLSGSWLLQRAAPACLLLPLAMGIGNREELERLKGADKAEPMRELLEGLGGKGAFVVARYNDYMYLLYYVLAEKRGGPVFLGSEVTPEQIAAYLDAGRPLPLLRTRQTVPPGLPVYSTRLELRPALRAAGLSVGMEWPGVYRVERGASAGSVRP